MKTDLPYYSQLVSIKITKIMNRSNINTKNDEMNNEFKNKPVDSKK